MAEKCTHCGRTKGSHLQEGNTFFCYPGDLDEMILGITERELRSDRNQIKALREQVQGIRPKRVQPCGCVLCFCEDLVRCSGCGAENCGNPECEVAKGNLIYEQHPYIQALRAALQGLLDFQLQGCAPEHAIATAEALLHPAERKDGE